MGLRVRWIRELPCPFLHVLFYEEGVIVDMKVGCPQDVKNMLRSQTNSNGWKEVGYQKRV